MLSNCLLQRSKTCILAKTQPNRKSIYAVFCEDKKIVHTDKVSSQNAAYMTKVSMLINQFRFLDSSLQEETPIARMAMKVIVNKIIYVNFRLVSIEEFLLNLHTNVGV